MLFMSFCVIEKNDCISPFSLSLSPPSLLFLSVLLSSSQCLFLALFGDLFCPKQSRIRREWRIHTDVDSNLAYFNSVLGIFRINYKYSIRRFPATLYILGHKTAYAESGKERGRDRDIQTDIQYNEKVKRHRKRDIEIDSSPR